MARLCCLSGRQRLLLRLQLLRQGPPSNRPHIALYLADLLPGDPHRCARRSASSPECSIRLCNLRQ